MRGERFKRLLLIFGVVVLVVITAGAFKRWQERKKVAGESIKLPTEVLIDKIEELGEGILGKAVEVLPVDEKTKKEVIKQETRTQESTETTKILETQVKEIVEILKQLPEEQLKQIRKQVFKDFCEKVMGE